MATDTSTEPEQLPLGTSPQYATMHKWIRRICYILLFGLVFEGALTFPLLALWYGVPSLSPTQVCSELQKVAYSDGTIECDTSLPLSGPPFGGPSEREGQNTTRDDWSITPKPQYPTVDYRELVARHDACEQWRESKKKQVNGQTVEPLDQYCNYITPGDPSPPDGGG